MARFEPRSLADGKKLSKNRLLDVNLRFPHGGGSFAQPITVLKGVGSAVSRRAARLGINTVGDLLEYPPFRHDDFSVQRGLGQIAIGEEATVLVEVRSCKVRPTRRRSLKLLECEVSDDTGTVKATWFNQAYLAEQLTPGVKILVRGKLDKGRGGLTLNVLSHELVSNADDEDVQGMHTLGLIPVYPSTEGLTTRKLRQMVWQVRKLAPQAIDPIPAYLLKKLELPRRGDALDAIHYPASRNEAATARRRLAFEELFIQQLAVATRKRDRQKQTKAVNLGRRDKFVRRWLVSLPFELTADQETAIGDLDEYLESENAMQALLMGEVGSGKTVVALHAMLRAIESGGQAALMAPTETLANQHFQTIDSLTGGLMQVGQLTGSTSERRRRELLAGMRDGSVKLVVGTHALIQDDILFDDLRLAVVDEQHRFGVEQRTALDDKGRGDLVPHRLHMTATPIPRTLAMTAYGDLDSIVLHQLPKGRKTVKTWLVPEQKRAGAYDFIRERLRQGRQCYIICPLVEESRQMEAKAVAEERERLTKGELRDFRVEAMHGQMSSKQKRSAMAGFSSGDVDVLVATSVVEVGVDVPNAAVIVIEKAERYGISQLHQLRGRIGRGSHESFCMLFAEPSSEEARRRLEAVVATQDGFELAEVDLQVRGEGEVLGTRQSGMPDMRFARMPHDQRLLVEARALAGSVLDKDEDLERAEHFILRMMVQQRLEEQRSVALAA